MKRNSKTSGLITFRMYCKIRFDRPVGKEHYISPGGFEMVFGGKSVAFDFCESECSHEGNTASFCLRDPDYAAFEELEKLTSKDLHELEEIREFFVYTGEDGDAEIHPVKLLRLSFRNFGTPKEDIDETIDYSDSFLLSNLFFEKENDYFLT